MTPGKEDFIFFEQLAKTQVRLYDDACDVGVVVDKDMFNAISKHTTALSAIYKTEREYGDTVLPRQSVWSMFMPWEMENGEYIGTHITLTFVQERRKKRMLIIDLKRHRQKEDPFKV